MSMRQILHTFLASCLWVILGAATLQAQGTERVGAVSGQPLELVVNSSPQRPLIQTLPRHGVASFRSTGARAGQTGSDIIDYVPTTGYYGNDTMLVQFWLATPYPRAVRTQYIITVGPSIVVANDDYATAAMGSTITADVASNDTGTFGNLSVATINSVANGAAGIQGNAISFTPAPGFRGVATVSYSVCDLLAVCDAATLNITVYDPNPSSDTLAIQVPKNGEQVVLIDEQGYPLTLAPANGNLSGSLPKLYRPDVDFVGTDEFRWASTINGVTYTKQVYVEVLDVPPGNDYAVDDEVFIAQNTTAYIDAKANDTQGGALSGFSITAGPSNGSASIVNGLIVYTPAFNYFGSDQITYRVFPPGYSGPVEYATIDIYVSDLPPAEFEYTLETPKNTPLVLDYPIPFTNYAFGISQPLAQHGDAAFYPSIDSTIAGYDVAGQRLLVYNPNTGFVGNDEVSASYCITSTGNCVQLTLKIEVLDLDPPAGGWCVQECVWPGDTDNNGLVELADLLPIGECHGSVGVPRAAPTSTRWTGVDAPLWQQQGANATDMRYIDADGDGLISAADTAEIVANLGRYHKPYAEAPARLSPLPLFIEFPFDTLYAGDYAYINLVLGTSGVYAEDIYGFTYDLSYNTSFILEGSQRLTYEADSWLSYARSTLSLTQDQTFGELSTAFTLTDGVARTGHGKVAQLGFNIVEDLLGIRPYPIIGDPDPTPDPNGEPLSELIGFADFAIFNASASTGGQRVRLPNSSVQIPVARRRENQALRNSDLVIAPNPARSVAQVYLNGADEITTLRVVNQLGQEVLRFADLPTAYALDVSGLPAGTYHLEASADEQVLHQTLIVR